MAYLTLLSFSLSMVLAMQQGRSAEDAGGHKSAKLRGQQICLLNAHDIREAFRVLAAQDASFVFEYKQLGACSINEVFEDALKAMDCCPVFRFAVPDLGFQAQEVSDLLTFSAEFSGLNGGHAPAASVLVRFSSTSAGFTHPAHWSTAPARAGPLRFC